MAITVQNRGITYTLGKSSTGMLHLIKGSGMVSRCNNFASPSKVRLEVVRRSTSDAVCSLCRNRHGVYIHPIEVTNMLKNAVDTEEKKKEVQFSSTIRKEMIGVKGFQPYNIIIPMDSEATEKLFKSALDWVDSKSCGSDRKGIEFLNPLKKLVNQGE